MKRLLYIILSMLIFGSVNAFAQEQEEQKVQTPEEMAAKEADRLGDLLKLEYWQVFYVDSTLQHDFTALQDEMNKLQSVRVENYDLYMSVRDKWFEHRAACEERKANVILTFTKSALQLGYLNRKLIKFAVHTKELNI